MIHCESDKFEEGIRSHNGFKELMTAIGYLLFQWSLLERELADQIIRLRREGGDHLHGANRLRATLNERLGEWRALLSRRRRGAGSQTAEAEALAERIRTAANLRNLIAHGFVTASAEPDGKGEPWVACVNRGTGYAASGLQTLRLSAIDALIDEMGRCRAEIRRFGPLDEEAEPVLDPPGAWQMDRVASATGR